MGKPISCDKERVSFNLARIKKGGKNYEVVVEPDNAIAYRKGASIDIKEVLRGEQIFYDAKKGIVASEAELKSLFNSSDPLKVAAVILKEGEIQLTTEYRDKLREEKKRRIIDLIHKNAVDPKTKFPHPVMRIENALVQVKCKIDEFASAEEQVEDIIKALRTVLPITVEHMVLQVNVHPTQAHQAYAMLKRMVKMKQEVWGPDGSVVVVFEIPAGMREDIMDKINSVTHGSADVTVVSEVKNK